MSDAFEALFTSTASEDNTTCSVQDLRTGTDLMRYKGGGSAQHHGLSLLGLNYLLSANAAKPLIHVWPLNKQEQLAAMRYVVPGKVNAMAVAPDAAFLVAGIQENIYVWHLNTGRMLNTIAGHYQAVTCLRFTDTGEYFISAGKDGAVLVWDLTSACAPQAVNSGQDVNRPLHSFNDHGLAVTDLHTGVGGTRSYLYTVSLDRCCKIYDLMGGVLLLSVVFPVALHSVTVDRLERSVYVGSGEGKVYVFHLRNTPRMTEYHVEEDEEQAFVGHTTGKAVTCLALNMSGTTLVSGGEDKQVCVWDIGSRQLIKCIPHNGAVTNLQIRLASNSIFQPEYKQPPMLANSLKRMISPPQDTDCIVLPGGEESVLEEGRQSPEIDLTRSVPGTIEELTLRLIGLLPSEEGGKRAKDEEIDEGVESEALDDKESQEEEEEDEEDEEEDDEEDEEDEDEEDEEDEEEEEEDEEEPEEEQNE
ncbi:hypothetical protein KR018_001057, partial [Drosophila ironensis]